MPLLCTGVRRLILAAVACASLTGAGVVRAQNASRTTADAPGAEPVRAARRGGAALTTARAARARTVPVIDGRDDDAAWAVAPVIDDFRQFTPTEDGDPSFRTEARILFDDRNLYVVVRAFDPHPDSILALLSRRDVRTNSDQLKILVDGYKDRRTGIQLMLNPAGVKRDASIYSDYIEDMTWDGVWDGAAAVDSLGWVAEFRLPFSQLRFNGDSASFGFGIWRDVARRNERIAWPAYRQSRQALASQLGTLEGIDGIQRGSRLELLPYTVTKNVTEATAEGWRHPQRVTAGLDLKYGLTPNLTLDATVNPDFGQVEVDPAILNLSAFEVRFEERRPFFQEGVGLFKCGGPCEGIFYTRRIGRTPQLRASALDPSGTAILGATKLTGRLSNGVAVGLVQALTRREEGVNGATVEPQTSYLVGRLVKEMRQGRSQVGTMVTAVNRTLDDLTARYLRRDAYNLLLQGFHRFGQDRYEVMAYTGFNRVGGSREAMARTQLSAVHLYQRPDHEETFDSTRTSLGGHVVAGSVSKIGGAWRWSSYARRASTGLELNDLGFVPTVNDVSIRNEVSWQALRPRRHYRRAYSVLSTQNNWTTGGLQAGARVTAHSFVELPSFLGVSVTYNVNDLGASHCVACARGGPAVRQSAKHELGIGISGDPRRVIIPRVQLLGGAGDAGRSSLWGVTTGAEVRVASQFSMSVDASLQRRDDDQQWIANAGAVLSDTTHFTFAHLDQTTLGITSRINWTASPTLSLQLYVQPFVSTGDFRDWREVDDPRAARYVDRYRAYGGGATPDGFSYKQFNSNAVLRWEYRPGSTLFLVWQQGRLDSSSGRGGFDFARDYRDLFRAHPDNTLLVKLAYWMNP